MTTPPPLHPVHLVLSALNDYDVPVQYGADISSNHALNAPDGFRIIFYCDSRDTERFTREDNPAAIVFQGIQTINETLVSNNFPPLAINAIQTPATYSFPAPTPPTPPSPNPDPSNPSVPAIWDSQDTALALGSILLGLLIGVWIGFFIATHSG